MSRVILHTEYSSNFGGQEIRIIKESKSMRENGYKVILAASRGAKIIKMMKSEGFKTYEISFKKYFFFFSFFKLKKIIEAEKVDIIHCHSSKDTWVATFTAKLLDIPIVRTRHLSLPIQPSLMTKLMYSYFVDLTITTCLETKLSIQSVAKIDDSRCISLASGIDPSEVTVNQADVESFKNQYNLKKSDLILGTVCILRSWKGIETLIESAEILKNEQHIKWLIIGSGQSEHKFRKKVFELGLEDKVIFTGFMKDPYAAIQALDVFLLLSTKAEGISQAHLQASYLNKPSITTDTGGLKEVCITGETGILVDKSSPQQVADAVLVLKDVSLREKLGIAAHHLVMTRFTWNQTIDTTKSLYESLLSKKEALENNLSEVN